MKKLVITLLIASLTLGLTTGCQSASSQTEEKKLLTKSQIQPY